MGGRGANIDQAGIPGGGVVKLIRQIPSVEVKFYDSAVIPTTAINVKTLVSDPTCLSGITQGTGNGQRTGRKIKVIGVVLRVGIVNTYCTPYTLDLVRDKQSNGAVPANTTVYTGTQWDSLPNPLFEDRFQYLKRVENLNFSQAQGAGLGAGTSTVGISFSKKCRFEVEYNASTGAVTDLSSDNLLVWLSSTGSLTNAADAAGVLRVLYTDA